MQISPIFAQAERWRLNWLAGLQPGDEAVVHGKQFPDGEVKLRVKSVDHNRIRLAQIGKPDVSGNVVEAHVKIGWATPICGLLEPH